MNRKEQQRVMVLNGMEKRELTAAQAAVKGGVKTYQRGGAKLYH